MSIPRANPSGWSSGARLDTRSTPTADDGYMTKIDKNIAYAALDKRAGANTRDTISSAVTVVTGGHIDISYGSRSLSGLVIVDPTKVSIAAGDLSIGASLSNQLSPVDRGYAVKNFTDTSPYTLTTNEYVGNLTFTGTISGVKNITFPTGTYRMNVINAMNYQLNLTAAGGSNTIDLNPGCSITVFGDGTNIYYVGKKNNNRFILSDVYNQMLPYNFTLSSLTATSAVMMSDLDFFYAAAGDILEVEFGYTGSLTVTTSGTVTGPSWFGSMSLTMGFNNGGIAAYPLFCSMSVPTLYGSGTYTYANTQRVRAIVQVPTTGLFQYEVICGMPLIAVPHVTSISMQVNQYSGVTMRLFRKI